jgi:hypothetical protein
MPMVTIVMAFPFPKTSVLMRVGLPIMTLCCRLPQLHGTLGTRKSLSLALLHKEKGERNNPNPRRNYPTGTV